MPASPPSAPSRVAPASSPIPTFAPGPLSSSPQAVSADSANKETRQNNPLQALIPESLYQSRRTGCTRGVNDSDVEPTLGEPMPHRAMCATSPTRASRSALRGERIDERRDLGQ